MKSVKLVHWLLFAFVFSVLSSCSLTGNDKDTVINVNEDFTIDMNQLLGSSRQLVFELASVEPVSCMNTSINNAVFIQNKKVTLLINNIEPASDCNPGEAAARATSHVGYLQNGDYDFFVTLRNTVTNEGKLTVSNDQFEISMTSSDGISILNDVMLRIPEETIWGYVAYDDENAVGAAPQDFINELESLTQQKQLEQGFYGYFNIATTGDLVFKTPPAFNHINSFFYEFDGEDEELINMLENYRNGSNGDNMELVIFTSNGKVL